ncbi:formate C-acetyltransferase, partial [Escherichia coli]|nr:formate C-acetyltransferase [Escherichia coli]
MQQHCQQQPENHFYQAALLLLKPRRNTFCVTLNWRKQWRQTAQMPSVVKNLLTIAEISRHNAEHKPQTFWQACQLFWYMNIILQYESNASSL